MARPNALGALLVLACGAALAQSPAGTAKAFPQHKCTLTLPPNCQWTSSDLYPGSLAAFTDAQGNAMFLTVLPVEDGIYVNEELCAGFDHSLLQTPGATKLSGSIVRFLGLPCYRVLINLPQARRLGMMKCFIANNWSYELVLLSAPDVTLSHLLGMESAFGCFSFSTAAPASADAANKPSGSGVDQGSSAYKFGQRCGEFFWWVVGAAVVMGAGKWLFGRG